MWRAIEKYGVTPLHRLSFAPLQRYKESSDAQVAANPVPARHGIFAKASSYSAKLAGARAVSNSDETFAKTSGRSHTDSPPPEHPTTRAVGNASETVATEELVRRGHEILERNWKTKYCEIDIISQKDGIYYFTEVKHRKNSEQGGGIAAITPRKLRQMQFAAKLYVEYQKLYDTDLRLVAVTTSGNDPVVYGYIEIE